MSPSIFIHPIASLTDNYIWAIVDTQRQRACIVDPGEAAPVTAFLEKNQLDLASILITHHHWDHTQGVGELTKTYSVPVFGSVLSPHAEITVRVKEGDQLPLEQCMLDLSVLSIPGHTLDHVAYYAPGILFCGDTLFGAGCGRVFEGSFAQMYQSLEKLKALPENTGIYCGHEYSLKNLRFSTLVEPTNLFIHERLVKVQALRDNHLPTLPSLLEHEKKTNPFFRCQSPELIAQVEAHCGKPLGSELAVFTELRQWKDRF